ncbi:site-2 protease family protein [Candidatus Micrarchaeota archaeon]|nr:site-2 protease family protein [Candidatus Micrarchaeota archaeon]
MEEAKEMIVSMLVIAFAIAIAQVGVARLLNFPVAQLLFYLGIVVVTVGSGFILHELAHRFVARKFGAYAVYKMWPAGLVIALVFALMGFLFAAPGAVYIFAPYLTRRQNGLISIAGPLTNVALALLFFAAMAFTAQEGIASDVFSMGMRVNLFLAFFNMIPIFPLDGSKVLAWNALIWGAVTLPLVLALLSLGMFF